MISKENIRYFKGKLQFLKFQIMSSRSRKEVADLYDVDQVYWVDVDRIKLSLDRPARDRLSKDDSPTVTPMLERGKVADGDWDLETIEFEDQDVSRAFQHRFEQGGEWRDTDFYRRVIRTINGGIPMWGCKTPEEFDVRCRRIDELYETIRDNGYQTQDRLGEETYRPHGNEDEIQVHIGRDGDYIFADGRHRFCIAKLLKLDRVAVKVARRHKAWVDFRREILAHAAKQSSGMLYARLPHPDLEDIPAVHAGDDRFQMILDNLPVKSGSLLDIGAHWGYFCHRFEPLGFDCVASEYLPVNQYFIAKLRDAEKRKFRIIEDSILNYREGQHFDIVLALNIFHHFIKQEDEHDRLQSFLERLDADAMFFEAHSPDEQQFKGTNPYRNFNPAEFAAWVRKKGGFREHRLLGDTTAGRRLYLLTR